MPPSIRTPRWTAAVVFAVLSVGHALVLPTFEGMDEPAHLSSILQFATGAGRPEPDRARLHQAVEAAIALAPGPYHQWPDLQEAIGATGYVEWRRLPLAERARREAALAGLRIDGWTPGIRENWQAQHPPLYYALMGRLVAGAGDGSFTRAHRVARLASALVFSTTGVLLTAFLTGAWGASPRAALFVVLFPMWYVMGARIANDALAIPALGLACLLAVDQLRRPPSAWSWTAWLAAGAAGALALAAKAYGLVFVPVAAIAALVAARHAARGRASWIQAVPPLFAAAITLGVNGWWLAENLRTTGFITGQNENADLLARGVVTLADRLPYARHLLVDEPWTVLVTLARAGAQALFVSNWTFGAAPLWFYPLQVGTLAGVAIAGRGPLGPTRRAAVAIAAVTAGAIVVGSAKAVVDFYILFGETRLAQGWYVWGAGVAVAAALALVFDRAPRRVQTLGLALQLICLLTAFAADAMYWSGRYDRHPTWRTPVAVADASSRPDTLGLAVRSISAVGAILIYSTPSIRRFYAEPELHSPGPLRLWVHEPLLDHADDRNHGAGFSVPRSEAFFSSDELGVHMSSKGTIKRIVSEKGFGFVADDSGQEYFFHQSACQSFDSLREGQTVTFQTGQGPKGPRAENVRES